MLYKGTGGNPIFKSEDAGLLNIPVHVPISYYLSSVDGKTAITLPNEPESVVYNAVSDHDVTYTIAGRRIHRRGIDRRVNIVIQGRSGYADKYFWEAREGAKLKDPQEIFSSFDKFLNEDHNTSSRGSTRSEPPSELVFTDLLAGVRFTDVVPVDFTYERDIRSTRLGYVWTLQMVAYNKAEFFTEVGVIAEFFNNMEDGINELTGALDNLTAIIQAASDYTLGPIRSSLSAVNRLAQSLVNLGQAIPNSIAAIRDTLTALRNTINNLMHSVSASVSAARSVLDDPLFSKRHWFDTWSDWSDAREMLEVLTFGLLGNNNKSSPNLEEIGLGLQEAEYNLMRSQGRLGRIVDVNEDQSQTGGSFLDKADAFRLLANGTHSGRNETTQDQGYTVYTLKAGQSLYDASLEVYGTVDGWTEIADANSWQNAHVDANGDLAKAGTRVVVPVQEGRALLNLSPQLIAGESQLLSDIALVDGDLELSRGLRDINLISGEANFLQALNNRASTVQGEIPALPLYGFENYIGSQNTTKRPGQIALDIIEQLLQDERVLAVNNVVVEQVSDQTNIHLEASPISGDAVTIALSV